LFIATLALASTIYRIFERHLLILNPRVRQYCFRRDRVIANEVSRQAELAYIVALQQTHTVSVRKVKAAAATGGCAPVSLHISVDYARDINDSLSQN